MVELYTALGLNAIGIALMAYLIVYAWRSERNY